MPNPFELNSPRGPLATVRRSGMLPALLGLLLGLFLVVGLSGQTAEAPEGLLGRLEEGYEVFALSGGVGLVPNQPSRGVRLIEVTDSGVAINGEAVSEEILRRWLEEDAAAVLELAALSPAARRALVGGEAPAGRVLEDPALEEPIAEGPIAEDPIAEDPVAEEPVLEHPAASPVPAEAEPGAGASEDAVPVDDASTDGLSTEEGNAEEGAIASPPPFPTPPSPISVSSDARVSVGSSLTIEANEVAEEVLVVGGQLQVDGEVLGNATVMGGDAEVSGRVLGTLTAFGGEVRLERGSEVQGDVVSVGGEVHRDSGARVHGEISEVAIGNDFLNLREWLDPRAWLDPEDWSRDRRSPFQGRFDDVADLINSALGMAFLALMVCFVLLLARSPVERVSEVIREEPWTAGLVGLLTTFLAIVLPIILGGILAISVIGCVLLPLVPLFWLAFMIVALFGYTASAFSVGTWFRGRFGGSRAGIYITSLIGVLLVQSWTLIGDALDLGGWPVAFLAVMFLLFGFLAKFCAWMVGIGGVVLSRFRTEENDTIALPPALPPVPGAEGDAGDSAPGMVEDAATASDGPLEPETDGDLPSEDELREEFDRALSESEPDSQPEEPQPEEPQPEPSESEGDAEAGADGSEESEAETDESSDRKKGAD